jgi:hypothetical protein
MLMDEQQAIDLALCQPLDRHFDFVTHEIASRESVLEAAPLRQHDVKSHCTAMFLFQRP